MLSFLNKIFSSSEINLIEFVDETKIIINIPLNAKKYLKDLSKKKWNSEKDIDYTFSESVSVNDSVSFWANERYAPEVKFFSSSNGEGFISVVNSKILFKIFWIIKSSEWPAWLLSGGTVIEKNKNRIKVEYKAISRKARF